MFIQPLLGAADLRILLRHIVPNSLPSHRPDNQTRGMVILTESMLSFLGIGIVPPNPPGEHGE